MVIAFLAFIAALRAVHEARRQADIAQNTLIASNRPWLKLIKFEPVIFTSDDKDGVSLRVKVSVENVGHSPAQRVFIGGELLIDQFGSSPDQAMEEECRKARASPFAEQGQVVFPNQPPGIGDVVLPRPFDIPADTVWKARRARIGQAPKRAHELAEFPFTAGLYLVGCVNYRFSDEGEVYQTNFKLEVGEQPNGAPLPLLGGKMPVDRYPEPAPDDPGTLMVFARKLQRIIPGDQVKLGNFVWGTFAR